MSKLKDKKLFLLDMDGTIYLDNDLFDGTLEFLDYVKSSGGKYMYITNNSSKSVDKYIEKLASLGIESTEEEFFPSTNAITIRYMLLVQLLLRHSLKMQDFRLRMFWRMISIVSVWALIQSSLSKSLRMPVSF